MKNDMGLYLPNSDSSTTSSFQYHSFSPEVKTTAHKNTTAGGMPQEQYHYLLRQYDALEKAVTELKKSSEQTETFFSLAVLLQRVCLVVIFLLPIVVLAVAALIVWHLSTDPTLVQCAKWYLGILGISSVGDLIYIFVTYKIRNAHIEDLERRVNNLESH